MRGPSDDKRDAEWHVDKTVPLALIVTIAIGGIGHTLTLAWALSNLWTRVGQLEHSAELAAPQFERIIRLEAKVDSITGSLTEIKALIRTPADQRR